MPYQPVDENEQDFTPVRSAWVNEQFSSSDGIEGRIEQIRRRGYTIIGFGSSTAPTNANSAARASLIVA